MIDKETEFYNAIIDFQNRHELSNNEVLDLLGNEYERRVKHEALERSKLLRDQS